MITRRDFIRGTLGTAIGTSLMGVDYAMGAKILTAPSRVMVVRDEEVMDAKGRSVDSGRLRAMLDETVMQLTGEADAAASWKRLVSPQDTVGLVPTDYFNATHEELVAAVTDSLVGIGVPREKIKNAQGNNRTVKTCTALICMPALKAHWLTGIGTVLKNYIMFSGFPSSYHDEKSAKLGEIWKLRHIQGKTKLVLVDALYPLCDKGPQPDPRYRWAYNGLIAGLDPVAVESVCLRVIEEKRRAMRGEPWPITPPPLCIQAADDVYGLGTSRMENIEITHSGWARERLI